MFCSSGTSAALNPDILFNCSKTLSLMLVSFNFEPEFCAPVNLFFEGYSSCIYHMTLVGSYLRATIYLNSLLCLPVLVLVLIFGLFLDLVPWQSVVWGVCLFISTGTTTYMFSFLFTILLK